MLTRIWKEVWRHRCGEACAQAPVGILEGVPYSPQTTRPRHQEGLLLGGTGDPGENSRRCGRGDYILLVQLSPPPHSLNWDLFCERG